MHADQVVLPADLLSFAPAYRPAILRAFGSHVIAASSAGRSSGGRARGVGCGARPAVLHACTAGAHGHAVHLPPTETCCTATGSGGAAHHPLWCALGHPGWTACLAGHPAGGAPCRLARHLPCCPTAARVCLLRGSLWHRLGHAFGLHCPPYPFLEKSLESDRAHRFLIPLQGGWRGDRSSRQPGPLHLKLLQAAAEQQLAAVKQEAAAAQAELEGVQRQLAEAAAQQEAAAAAAAELAAAERELSACQQALESQQAAQTDAEAALGRLQAELAAKRQVLSSMAEHGQCSGAQAALEQEVERLAGAVKELESAAGNYAAHLAAAVTQQGRLEAELAVIEGEEQAAEGQPVSQEAGSSGTTAACRSAARLSLAREELAAAAAALSARQAQLAAQSEAVAAHEAEVEQAAADLSAAEQAQVEAERRMTELAQAAEERQAGQQELQQQLDGLLAEVPELAAVLGAGAGSGHREGGGGGGVQQEASDNDQSVADLRRAAASLGKQRARLLEERRRSSAARLPVAELMRLREQQAALGAARQQASTLGTAVQRLQEGIAASSGQASRGGEGQAQDTVARYSCFQNRAACGL